MMANLCPCCIYEFPTQCSHIGEANDTAKVPCGWKQIEMLPFFLFSSQPLGQEVSQTKVSRIDRLGKLWQDNALEYDRMPPACDYKGGLPTLFSQPSRKLSSLRTSASLGLIQTNYLKIIWYLTKIFKKYLPEINLMVRWALQNSWGENVIEAFNISLDL